MAVKPTQYVPSFLASSLRGTRPVQMTYSDVIDTNTANTSSFYYDSIGTPLKSTQQLNVDWSRFENHVFFNSAEVKVNTAFDQIINGFPFDGTLVDIERFFEGLTGFDKWVFDQFPKYKGALHFSGSYITVNDSKGGLFPSISPISSTGKSVLNPGTKSLSIEMQLSLPALANDNQIIVQKHLNGHGFSLHLSASASTSTCALTFAIMSGAMSTSTTTTVLKGKFNHICAVFDRDTDANVASLYVDEALASYAAPQDFFGTFQIDESPFIIGSGSAVTYGFSTFTPKTTLSGTMDELRVFHTVRSQQYQKAYAKKSVNASDDMVLYYKFNEPPPPLTPDDSDSTNAIVIDSSGNSLHSVVTNFTGSLRISSDADASNPMSFEKDIFSPVLFPAHADVIALNTELLLSASDYDSQNPNIITRLIPQHYLLDGMEKDGLVDPNGSLTTAYTTLSTADVRGGKLGSTQLLLSLLYITARFFDEMKVFVDSFSTVRYIDHETYDTVPDNFLPMLMKRFGFNMPTMFTDATIEQYVNAENVSYDISTNLYPLKYVQTQLLRRILTNVRPILLSKGTQHSIKAFLRAVGIDPDNSMRFREYGGPTERTLAYARERKNEFGTMVCFTTASLVESPALSASRVEPGFPYLSGAFVDLINHSPFGISDSPSDGLLTSGSWTFETIVKYTSEQAASLTSLSQSLCRLYLTGTFNTVYGTLDTGVQLLANLVAEIESDQTNLVLYVKPGLHLEMPVMAPAISLPKLTLQLDDVPITNGDKWYVSFGCVRNDATGSVVSSSYFVRAATQEQGTISVFKTTSSFFYEGINTGSINCFRQVVDGLTGPHLAVGASQTIHASDDGFSQFLNYVSFDVPQIATAFDGMMSHLRFWSKALSESEWREHVRNYRSAGVDDPLVNYNFVKTREGSFEKLRLESLIKQDERRASPYSYVSGAVGDITFIDFSQNNNHLTGSGFSADTNCVVGEWFSYSYLSPYFDSASNDVKIRARGFLSQENIDEAPWAAVAPVHELVKSEHPTDDTRFTIEFSLIDAVNRDIITMFASLDEMNNAIGNPELVYSPDYPTLANLSDIYFNRLSGRLNFKAFFEFYRWFDSSIGTFIEQLLPRKTRFKGANFTVESHMLERHKLRYLSDGIYLGESDRDLLGKRILLQALDCNLKKY